MQYNNGENYFSGGYYPMGLRPLHDWVLIRRTGSEEKTSGGIFIPESAREKNAEGIIEAVGPGRYRTGPSSTRPWPYSQ